MSEAADFGNRGVANRGNPEPFLAPRPGFEQIVAFLVRCGFHPERAEEIAVEFLDSWYMDYRKKPTVKEFLMWLEGEI